MTVDWKYSDKEWWKDLFQQANVWRLTGSDGNITCFFKSFWSQTCSHSPQWINYITT